MSAILVTNLTASTSATALREFFSYSGEVVSVEQHEEPGTPPERSAVVVFASAASLDTALLLSGASIVAGEPPITVVATALPAGALPAASLGRVPGDDDGLAKKAGDVLALLVAKGAVLGKGALEKAKALDEKAGASTFLKEKAEQLRVTERAKAGAEIVKGKARELDERYGLVEKAQGMAGAAATTAASILEKAKNSEALSSAGAAAKSWFGAAADKAAGLVAAAKMKAEQLGSESAVAEAPPASAPVPAPQ